MPYVPSEPATLPPWADWLVNTSVAALLGLIGWFMKDLQDIVHELKGKAGCSASSIAAIFRTHGQPVIGWHPIS